MNDKPYELSVEKVSHGQGEQAIRWQWEVRKKGKIVACSHLGADYGSQAEIVADMKTLLGGCFPADYIEQKAELANNLTGT